MAGKPCLGLRDGIIAQILSVRHRHILTKLAEDIVSQLVDGVGNGDRRDLLLHLPQFLQRDRNGDLSEGAGLLILQNGKARVPILHIGRHDLQFQAVIQRFQDLFLRIVEIRDLIGGRKKRNDRNGIGASLVGVFPLIEGGEQ